MKIGILLPTNVYFSPYSHVYTDLFDEMGVNYDIIYFDKRNLNEPAAYRFSAKVSSTDGQLRRFWGYYRYARFLCKTIKKEKYDRLIVCGPQIAIFLYSFLKKYYAGKFILDYRDLSIEQRFMSRYKKLLAISAYNMISSPGFKRCLPAEAEYILSHNFSIDLLRKAISPNSLTNMPSTIPTLNNGKISVLTIGGIRDFEQNAAVMLALANRDVFETAYIGRGEEGADVKLHELAEKNHIDNVHFEGYYKKEAEPSIISHCTFLNIFYPRKLSHDTALSNRFYSSLIFRKPFIATKDTIQGDYAEKYGVGIAITTAQDLDKCLQEYISNFNSQDYEEKRNQLLLSFLNDYNLFREAVTKFVG